MAIHHRTNQVALPPSSYIYPTACELSRGHTAVASLYQVVHQDAEPLARHVAWPSARTEAVLRRGMAKDREARFSTVLEFAHALEDAIGQDLGGAQPASGIPRSLAPLRRAAEDLAVIVPRPS